MKRYRWSCPEGKHPGVLAPGRLRTKDIRRYCLECSQEQGVLVERTCAALEKQRQAKKEQTDRKRKRQQEAARKKRQAKKAQERQSAFNRKPPKPKKRVSVRGIDVVQHAHRIASTPFVVQAFQDLERKPLQVQVRTRHKGDYTTGQAWCETNRMVLTLPVACSFGKMAVLVAHELAHLAVADEEVHGPAWRDMFLRILNEGYGFRTHQGDPLRWPRNNGRLASYNDAHFQFETLVDRQEVIYVEKFGGQKYEALFTSPVLDMDKYRF